MIYKSFHKYMYSKKQLAVTLSRLQSFERPSLILEQYPTDSEIAAEVIWFAYQNRDITGKKVADLGCGTGILGIGTMFFNPQKVYFVDVDERPLNKLQNNLQLLNLKTKHEIICENIALFNYKVDTIFQNPPFGIKREHADKIFLLKAFEISQVIYSFHKIESNNFIKKISQHNNFRITHYFEFEFPLKKAFNFHMKKIHKIKVGCWRLEKTI